MVGFIYTNPAIPRSSQRGMGRKKSSYAADRLLGSGEFNFGVGSDRFELNEEDVWASGAAAPSSCEYVRNWRRWEGGGKDRRQVSGLSLEFKCEGDHPSGSCGAIDTGISSPVSVPLWGGRTAAGPVESATSASRSDGEETEEWVPPHEYLAREKGKSAVATSVFEGVGRTLKGRDMSRVRDAVWSQIGYSG
ncbi:hypothetical protein HPP92_010113 [Vanilla planifolia]|uniref:Senescence regulator n=1 Tax=Vanilla planifolia TaxID=51239 RepID=A0A835QT98_VANPL|nr:hypothetical protein HPP92_010113 [Vanilla planifolia]